MRQLNEFNGSGGEVCPELRVRHVRELYRYRKLSEWLFDLLYRTLLNFGHWVMSLAEGIQSGYTCFHDRRDRFEEEKKLRPPVFVSGEQADGDLKQVRESTPVIVR